jgi:hypothetical protein
MLIVRLRGELPTREFVDIAKLYSEIRRWTVKRASPLGNNHNPKGENQHSEPEIEPTEPLKPIEDVMARVLEIEAQKKG